MANAPKYKTAEIVYYELLKKFATENRQNPTEAEKVMWIMLCSKGLNVKFRRQHIIGKFIADFVSLRYKLVIEIDGHYHSLPEQAFSDEVRTEYLSRKGFRVIRFTNEEVIGDTENVLNAIINELNKIPQE